METIRKPFQGVINIIRFNWHFYVIAVGASLALLTFSFSGILNPLLSLIPAFGILFVTVSSLLASTYVYDLSNLYSLEWLNKLKIASNTIINVNAGFDETSQLLQHKYKNSTLIVLDFYDAKKHTEVSIKRARKAYPPYSGTIQIQSDKIPHVERNVDTIFAILSAHEIRDDDERQIFFKELKRVLKPNGQIIVTEHLRDLPNFLAYTIGFFHFHSRSTWLKTFEAAQLKLSKEIKITPFLTTFILEHA